MLLAAVFVPAASAAGPIVTKLSPTHGPVDGGTTVTLTGNKFTWSGEEPTDVSFDGEPVDFTIDSDTQITTTSPAHDAGTVKLVVSNSKGTRTLFFTYDAPQTEEPTPDPEPTPSESQEPEPTPEPEPSAEPTPTPEPDPEPTPTSTSEDPGPTPTYEDEESEPTSEPAPTTTPTSSSNTPQQQDEPEPEEEAKDGGATRAPRITAAAVRPAPTVTVTIEPVVPNSTQAGSQGQAMPTCWVGITPTAPGERVVVPFPKECGIESVVVNLPDASRPLNLTVQELHALPHEVPVPEMGTVPAIMFEAELRDHNGTVVQPESAIVQVRVTDDWLATCLPPRCVPELFHYHAGAWSRHALTQVDAANGTAVYEAETPGFSIFAVAGVRAPESWFTILGAWSWGLVPFLVAGTVGTTLFMRRRHQAETAARKATEAQLDAKVNALLSEMKGREDLLQFVNNAAHDLANPLTPIMMQLDLLGMASQGQDDPRQSKSLAVVKRNVQQLHLLITDLRDASKLQAGKLRMSLEPVELGQLARDVAESYIPQAAQAKIQLSVETPDELWADADPARLTQVITNFLNNALKFTPAEGKVWIKATRSGGQGLIEIVDSGLGLTIEDQERLFKPFSQVHGEKEKKKGTGLGLFIAKGIVESHHGAIGCRSAGPGLGSTFWFSIPVKPPGSDAPGLAQRMRSLEIPKDGSDASKNDAEPSDP